MRTKASTLVGITAVACLAAMWQYMVDLDGRNQRERPATLTAVWGNGTQVAGGAQVSWYTSVQGTHHVKKAGRQQPARGQDTGTESWQEVVLVGPGDKIIFQVSPDIISTPVGTSIHYQGKTWAGGRRLEITVP